MIQRKNHHSVNRREFVCMTAVSGLLLNAPRTLLAQSLFPASQRQLLTARNRTVIRGEPRQSAAAPAGSFARAEIGGLLFLTNGFSFQHEIPHDSYIEWHFDGTNTKMKFRCINSDQYRVKAFPCAVLGTMGGRWETNGKPKPVAGMENEFRMKGEGMQSPLFDLLPAQQATGFPCMLSDLPQTTVHASTRYSGNPTVNTFLDMYLHDVDSPRTVSHSKLTGTVNGINSNRTKAYNINVWFRKPDQPNGNSGRPDDAWAGGKVIGLTNIAGQMFHVIFKIESVGGNHFRYIGLIPESGPITQIKVNHIMDWAQNGLRALLENHPVAQPLMAKPDPRGLPPPRWPDKRMVLSGLHLGNEIWWSDPAGQEGIVHWDTLRIDVANHGNFGWGQAVQTSAARSAIAQQQPAAQPEVRSVFDIDETVQPHNAGAPQQPAVPVQTPLPTPKPTPQPTPAPQPPEDRSFLRRLYDAIF